MRRYLIVGLLAALLAATTACAVPAPPPPTDNVTSGWTVIDMPKMDTVMTTREGYVAIMGLAGMVGKQVRIRWACGLTLLQDQTVTMQAVGTDNSEARVPLPAEMANGVAGFGYCSLTETTFDAGIPAPTVLRHYDWANHAIWGVAIAHGVTLAGGSDGTWSWNLASVTQDIATVDLTGDPYGLPGTFTFTSSADPGRKVRFRFSCPGEGYRHDVVFTIAEVPTVIQVPMPSIPGQNDVPPTTPADCRLSAIWNYVPWDFGPEPFLVLRAIGTDPSQDFLLVGS